MVFEGFSQGASVMSESVCGEEHEVETLQK